MREKKQRTWSIIGVLLFLVLFTIMLVLQKKGEQNMYLYFDNQGNLKEQIIFPLRSGDSDKKVYAYFEDATPTNCYINYELSDGTYYYPISPLVEGSFSSEEIPYNKNRDLKYFKYNTTYRFMKFTIPEDVLKNVGSTSNHTTHGIIGVEVSCLVSGESVSLASVPVMVEKNALSVVKEEGINLAQWNEVMKWIGNGRFSVLDATPSDWTKYANQLVLITDVANESFKAYKVSSVGVQTELSIQATLPAYIKSVSVSGNSITFTKKDDTTIVYNPTIPDTYVKETSISGDELTITDESDNETTFKPVVLFEYGEGTFVQISNVWALGTKSIKLQYEIDDNNAYLDFDGIFQDDQANFTISFSKIINGVYVHAMLGDNNLWSNEEINLLDSSSNQNITGIKTIDNTSLAFRNGNNATLFIVPNQDATGGEIKLPNSGGTLARTSDVQDALTPTTPKVAQVSNNKLTFSNVSKKGLYVLSFGYCTTLIVVYGNTNNQTYKCSGTFIYDGQGSVVTTTLNYKFTNDTTLEIWSGNTDKPIYNGLTAYLTCITLY